MALTTEQKAALAADIALDPAFAELPHNTDGAWAIAAAYNLPATPDFYIWKTSVGVAEIMANGFDWLRVDNLTVGKARIWEWMAALGTLSPAQANQRAGVLAVFSTAGDLAMRQAIFSHCQRLATRVQKLFATGAGTTVTDQGIGPAAAAVESVDYHEVQSALGW